MINIDKKKAYLIIAGILLSIFLLWSVYGISDNGGGIDTVRSELGTTQSEQHSVTNSLGTVESGLIEAGNTASGISEQLQEARTTNTNIINRNTKSESYVGSSGELITDCQRILKQVRERGQSETN